MLDGPWERAMSTHRIFTTAFKRDVAQEYLAGASLNALERKHEVAQQSCFDSPDIVNPMEGVFGTDRMPAIVALAIPAFGVWNKDNRLRRTVFSRCVAGFPVVMPHKFRFGLWIPTDPF